MKKIKKSSDLSLYGVDSNLEHNPVQLVGRIDHFTGITSQTPVKRINVFKITEGTICYFRLTGTATSVNHVTLLWCELPISGKIRTIQDVLNEMNVENTHFHEATMEPGDTTERVLEDMIGTDFVDVPGLQATPAVIDTLEVVSTDTDDDGDPAGDGARTIKIEYWDTTGVHKKGDDAIEVVMNGTTPVVVDVSALSIWVVGLSYVATVGSKGSNQGDISLTDIST